MSVLHLDLRDRPPPEPMERILQALPILPDGWRLVALTPMRPLPLLPMLEADGYAWRVLDLEQGGAMVTICRGQEAHLRQAAGLGLGQSELGARLVELPEARDLVLKIGSNDGFKCWFNGEAVGRFDGGRAYAPDQSALPVHAKAGVNTVLLKVTQMGGAWAFSARLTAPDGTPINLAAK